MSRPTEFARRRWHLLAFLALCCLTGCSLPRSPMNATVPPEWRHRNSWGPEGNAARAAGLLLPCCYPPELVVWREMGRQTIQDGDLLFRRTHSYRLTDRLASAMIAQVGDSPFSHNGIAHWENGVLYVYDTVPHPQGVRKVPFEFWALDNAPHAFAVKRLKPEYRDHIPAAMAYVEDVYCRQVPFDMALRLDDERLYCSEMTGKAFLSTGLVLADPIPIRCLPHYQRFAFLTPLAQLCLGINVNEPIYTLGNSDYGLFGSPKLELVYSDLDEEVTESRAPSRCGCGQ